MVPKDEVLESELTTSFEKLRLERNRDGGVNLAATRLKMDELKKLAWCPLYHRCNMESNAKRQAIIKEFCTVKHITDLYRI